MAHRFNPKRVEKLESPERMKMLPLDEIFSDFPLHEQDVVADMGAGAGYFTLPLSNRVQKVLAVDIEPEMLDYLADKLERAGVENVQLVQSDMEQTPLPDEGCDKLIASLVMHELESVESGAREFYRVLKPGGWALIIDWKKEPMEEGPPVEHRIDAKNVRQVMTAQGFVQEKERELKFFYLLVFRKPH